MASTEEQQTGGVESNTEAEQHRVQRRGIIGAVGGLLAAGALTAHTRSANAVTVHNDVLTADTLSDLVLIDPGTHPAVVVLGGDSIGDGAGALYIWDANSTTRADGLTIVEDPSHTPGRWLRGPLGGPVNVKWFGATGDGNTDDTAAVKAAMAFIAGLNRHQADFIDRVKPSLYFPAGVYRLTESAVFSTTASSGALNNLNGFRVHGDGWRASVLYLDSATEAWFYDNGPNTRRYIMMQFEHLMFRGTPEGPASGFRTWSSGHEQGFRFLHCHFTNLQRVIEVTGPFNAAENKFIDCWISHIEDAVWVFNNPQSVANEFHSVDCTDIYGDLIRVEAGGGGSFRMYGGTLVFRDHRDQVTKTWLLNADAGSTNLGPANNDFLFSGVKAEMHGEQTGLVRHEPTQNTALRVLFQGTNFYTSSPTRRDGVRISKADRVVFENCYVSNSFTYHVESGTNGFVFGHNGDIVFTNCEIPEDLPELIHFAALAGSARARGCRFQGIGALDRRLTDHAGTQVPTEYLVGVALDFDLSAGPGYADGSCEAKALRFDKGVSSPFGGRFSRFAVLPPGAILTGLYVIKHAQGGSVAPYQLEAWLLGPDPSQDELLGTSVAALNRDEHIIDLPTTGRLMKRVGSVRVAEDPPELPPLQCEESSVNCFSPLTRSRTIEIRAENGDSGQAIDAWVFYI